MRNLTSILLLIVVLLLVSGNFNTQAESSTSVVSVRSKFVT